MRKLLSLLASLAMLTTMSPFYTEGTTDNSDDVDSLADSSEAVNSETKDCCPHCCHHNISSTSVHKITCNNCPHCSNDENNSSDEDSGEKKDITQLRFVDNDYTSAYSVKDGVKTLIECIVCCGNRIAARTTDCDYINVELNGEYNKYKHFVYGNSKRVIGITLSDKTNETYADYRGNIDISDYKVDFVNKGTSPFEAELNITMEEGTYNFPPYYQWDVWGNVANNFSVEITDNGLLLTSDDKIEMTICAYRYITDKNGEIQYGKHGPLTDHASVGNSPTEKDLLVTLDDKQKVSFYIDENDDEGEFITPAADSYYYISSPNNVLVTVNEEHIFECYIDDNNDGIYDCPVQKGDANYDGVINASDASAVLAHYAKLSTSSENIDSDTHTMDFDRSGSVDAADASRILKHYADVQTS